MNDFTYTGFNNRFRVYFYAVGAGVGNLSIVCKNASDY